MKVPKPVILPQGVVFGDPGDMFWLATKRRTLPKKRPLLTELPIRKPTLTRIK